MNCSPSSALVCGSRPAPSDANEAQNSAAMRPKPLAEIDQG